MDDIIVITEEYIFSEEADGESKESSLERFIRSNRGKIFMLDEADHRLGKVTTETRLDKKISTEDKNKDLRYYIERDNESTYILMTRSVNTGSYGTTQANIATVVFSDNKFSLDYRYDVGGWQYTRGYLV